MSPRKVIARSIYPTTDLRVPQAPSLAELAQLGSAMQSYADRNGAADSTLTDAAVRNAQGDLGQAADAIAESDPRGARQLREQRSRIDEAINIELGDETAAAHLLERRGHQADADLLRRRVRAARAEAIVKSLPLSQRRNDEGVPQFDRRLLTEAFAAEDLGDLLPHALRALDRAEQEAVAELKRRKAAAEEREAQGYAPLPGEAISFPQLPPIDWWSK